MKCFAKTAAAICLALNLMLAGCSTVKRDTIAYTVYPIGYLIQRIAGDTVKAVSIQKDMNVPVQCAEAADNYQTTLKSSIVLFHIGDLEPYITVNEDEISSSGVEEQDLSAVNAVYKFERYTRTLDDDGKVTWKESPYYKGEAFDSLDVTEKDLSLWNDPIAMLSMAKDIESWMIDEYPDNEQTYKDNLSSLENDLIDLDAQYQAFSTELTDSNKKIAFVSVTPSFGNWQKAYGFQVYPLILSKYGVAPTDAQLAIIEQTIKDAGVKYIADEPNLTSSMKTLYEKVKNDLNLTAVSLSNLSSLSNDEDSDGKDYLSIMYENLNALQEIAVGSDAAAADN